jgi:hypothetical protein
VHEQYPKEIIDRRRQLVPIMKDARGKGHCEKKIDFTLTKDGFILGYKYYNIMTYNNICNFLKFKFTF